MNEQYLHAATGPSWTGAAQSGQCPSASTSPSRMDRLQAEHVVKPGLCLSVDDMTSCALFFPITAP